MKYKLTNKHYVRMKVLFIKQLRSAFQDMDLREAKLISEELLEDWSEGGFVTKTIYIGHPVKDKLALSSITAEACKIDYQAELEEISVRAIRNGDTQVAIDLLVFIRDNL